MGQYLLSTYRVEGEVPGSPQGPEEMQAFMGRVIELEEDMHSSGAFVFGGALRASDAASVVDVGDALVTDGPFAELKEQIAGFYMINSETDDDARRWARRVAEATNHPIEIRPFAATGLVKDMAMKEPLRNRIDGGMGGSRIGSAECEQGTSLRDDRSVPCSLFR